MGRLPGADAVLVYDVIRTTSGGITRRSHAGKAVTLVTPSEVLLDANTMEQHRIEEALLDQGVTLIAKHTLSRGERLRHIRLQYDQPSAVCGSLGASDGDAARASEPSLLRVGGRGAGKTG